MQPFTERQHAYLSADFYRLLKELDLPQYQHVFRFAVSVYALGRGIRMALRCLRDGRDLDYPSYRYYKEWAPTQEFPASSSSSSVQEDGSLCQMVRGCPWAAQYLAMELPDGLADYCAGLDASIVRGFNPALRYEMHQQIQDGSVLCRHCQYEAHLEKDTVLGAPDPRNRKDFAFHCAHLYFAFSAVMASVYGEMGRRLSEKVMDDFAAAYGQEAADMLLQFAGMDFLRIDT